MPNWDNTERLRLLNAHYIPLPANIGARVYASQGFTHNSTGNWLPIEFNTERWDTGITNAYTNGVWDVANPTRLTAIAAGHYNISGHVLFDTDATGVRLIDIRLNGNLPIAQQGTNTLGASIFTTLSVSTNYWLDVGDYAELRAWQNSGGNLDMLSSGNISIEFVMVRIP